MDSSNHKIGQKMKYSVMVGLCCLVLVASGQTPITSIPFELYGDHIFVKASVDGSEPLDFIFDTGSGITVIDRDIADGLDRVKHHVVLNEGLVRGSLIKHNEIVINGYQMEKNIKVFSTDLHHLEISIGREFDGVVGYDFMKHHDVRINYNEYVLEVYEKGQGPNLGQAIPFKLVHHIPVIDARVVLNNDEPHDGTFFLMTGAATTLDFNAPYANEWDVIHKTGEHYSYYLKSISEKESLEYEGFIKSITFESQQISNLPVSISQAVTGIHSHKSVSGIIGNQILKRYNITYDYSNKVLYMMKNHHYGEGFALNSSGIDIQFSKDWTKILIHQVFENSPASEVNIKVNSELVKINGQNALDLSLPEIKEILTQKGNAVDLVIATDGVERTVTLTLRSLL